MKDYIVRATAGDGQIRAFAATTGNLVEEARKRHDTSPVATAALGRLLTAGAMMGGMMKNETDVLTLQIKGDGPLGGITVTADAKGDVKGYVDHPEAMMPPKNGKLDVGGAVGIGLLNVIKDMGLKEPYVGQTILQTSEIAEDLTYYFATSEQVPSSVGLGVLMNKDNTVHCAGGFIVQVMPFISDEVLDKLEENIKKISSVTSMLDNGHTPEQMLEQVLDGLRPRGYRMLELTKLVRDGLDRYEYMQLRHSGGSCIAIGCGAGGKLDNYLYHNNHPREILSEQAPICSRGRVMDPRYQILDAFIYELQKARVDLRDYSEKLECDLEGLLEPEITRMEKEGLIHFQNGVLSFTDLGVFWGNNIVEELMRKVG